MKKSEVEAICDKALYAHGIMAAKDLVKIRKEYFRVSQTGMRKLLGYKDSSSISHYERGERKTSPDFICRILGALKQ